MVACSPDEASPLQFITSRPCFQNGAKSGFEMVWLPAPLVPGVPTKTRLESNIHQCTPHLTDTCRQNKRTAALSCCGPATHRRTWVISVSPSGLQPRIKNKKGFKPKSIHTWVRDVIRTRSNMSTDVKHRAHHSTHTRSIYLTQTNHTTRGHGSSSCVVHVPRWVN